MTKPSIKSDSSSDTHQKPDSARKSTTGLGFLKMQSAINNSIGSVVKLKIKENY
jgi:hypothetical protein